MIKPKPFFLTANCPPYPDHLHVMRPTMPCPDLTDEQVDDYLLAMAEYEPKALPYPTTQYGRRTAVQNYRLYLALPLSPRFVPKDK